MYFKIISKLVFIIILFLLEGNIISQTVDKSFEGITWSDKRPPDPEIAVGPNHIILVVNSKIAIYSKDGVLISNNNLLTFFNSITPPGDPFDPRVVYDHLSSRWVVYALSRTSDFTTSNYLIAVSQNTDPTSQWYYYKFNARLDNSTNTNNWADYTGLGYNEEAVYITSNQMYIYGTQDFQYAKIRAIKKSDLYSGVSTPAYKDFTNMLDESGGTKKSENIQPAHQFGTASKFYLMNTANDITANYVVVWSITNPFGASPVIAREAIVNVGQYNPPIAVVQKNSTNTLEPNDAKISDCVFRNGFLYGCFTIKNSTNNGNAIKYIKINTTNFSLAINDVIEAQNIYYFYPEIYPDLNDNLVLVFNKASSNDYAGVAWTYRYANTSSIGGISWLKQGEAAYYNPLNNVNRWGDYSGICLDPSDNRKVWVYGEYAKTSTTWSTWVGMINMTILIPTQFSNLIGVQNADGSLTVNNSVTVISGQSSSVYQGNNSVKTNNERFVNWNSGGLTYKHNNWNNINTEKLINHNFIASFGAEQEQNANFIDLQYSKVQLELDNILATGNSNLEFQDPWYILSNGDQPGNYWIPFASYYEPTGKEGASEKGVFLNQDYNIPGQPYYSVRAVSSQTISNYTAYFQNWSTNSAATLQNPSSLETGVVFNSGNAVVTANYKGHLISNSTNSFNTNSQRKVVRTNNGHLHMVYESMNAVWYTRSTSGGAGWESEIRVSPLGVNAKSASIAHSNDGLNKIYIVYQRDAGQSPYFEPKVVLTEYEYIDTLMVQTWSADVYTLSSYSYDTKPVVAALNNTVCVVFKPSSTSGLREKNFYYDGISTWTPHADFLVQNTTSSSTDPSISSDVQRYFLTYQNGNTTLKFLEFFRGTNDAISVYEESTISTGSPYTNNNSASISTHEGDPIISWNGHSTGIPTAVVKRRVGGVWSNFSSFASGAVRNTNNNSVDAYTDGSIIGWCNIYNQYQYVRLFVGSYSGIQNLSITNGNGQIQLSNGYDFHGIKAVVTQQPTNNIYPVTPLTYDFLYMQKASGDDNLNYGRMAIVQLAHQSDGKGKKNFVYYLGGVKVDGENIKFTEYSDTLKIKNIDMLNEVMSTEHFHLIPKSEVVLSNSYYAFDNDEYKEWKENDASFSIELVNLNGKVVKAEFNNSKFELSTITDDRSSFKLDCSNIEEGTYYLRVKCKVDKEAEYFVNNVMDEDLPSLNKGSYEEIKIEGNGIPNSYQLANNYPNPFNPTTVISFSLPKQEYATLKVYDVLGKEVAVLVDGVRNSGKHEVTFKASELASGIYFYTLKAGEFSQTNKMIFLK